MSFELPPVTVGSGRRAIANSLTHGHARPSQGGRSHTYRAWECMKSRCTNAESDQYANYGGRGITLCERWLNFANFLADMGERPAGKTLDRRDNSGNYTPANCRWATPTEQARNRRSTRIILFRGRAQSLKAWCDELDLAYHTTWWRLRAGFDIDVVFSKPAGGRRLKRFGAQLSAADIASIRELRGVQTQRVLAKRFAVAASTICGIQNGAIGK